MSCVDIGNRWLNPIFNAFASFSFWLVFRIRSNYHIKMHVGVCAVVVGKDKAARVGRGEKSPPAAYQSVLNCFIITEMHRHNFLLKIMQSFISLS